MTTSCGFACRIILLCKAIVQLEAKQRRTKHRRPQIHHIQIRPIIMSISLSLSPYLDTPTELCPKICTDYFCQLTHAQSPLRSPTSVADGCGWRFMTQFMTSWQLWCSRSLWSHSRGNVFPFQNARLTSLDTTPQETQPC